MSEFVSDGYWRQIVRLQEEKAELKKSLEEKQNRIDGLYLALKDSITWHDDSGRYIPAFNSVKEAEVIYEFGEKDEQHKEAS